MCLITFSTEKPHSADTNHGPTQDSIGKGFPDTAAGHQLGPPPNIWTTMKTQKTKVGLNYTPSTHTFTNRRPSPTESNPSNGCFTHKSLRSSSLAEELPQVSRHGIHKIAAVTPLSLSHYQAQVSNL